MRYIVTFLTGFLDYPRGTTIAIRDHTDHRAYRNGRTIARRMRDRAWGSLSTN